MKKILVFTLTLVLTLSVGYITLGSTIGIGVTEGFQAKVWKQIDPSADDTLVTGYYGVNEELLLSLGYYTDCKDIELGLRYALAENMALTLKHHLYDAEEADDDTTLGFRYKAELSDALALVGVLEYTNTDPDETIGLIGQAEYTFTDMIVGTLGFDYRKTGDDSGTNTIIGIETYPTQKLSVYLDYTIVDEDNSDDTLALGVSYAF